MRAGKLKVLAPGCTLLDAAVHAIMGQATSEESTSDIKAEEARAVGYERMGGIVVKTRYDRHRTT
jgi:hypothetical protein